MTPSSSSFNQEANLNETCLLAFLGHTAPQKAAEQKQNPIQQGMQWDGDSGINALAKRTENTTL
ncbi:MAG: hypothetical protein VKJ04_09360 [Vampirovibrionales bacterium]|nr:hypothetical protein [Vampirovibrionales bacterium]